MNKSFKRIIIILCLITLLILYLLNSSLIIKSILNYTKLFIEKLFPVQFLFFTLSTLLIDYGLIELISNFFNLNTSSFYIFFMSLISGFPSGSKYTKELLEKNLLTEESANKIIMSTHFPNPLFMLGTVYLILNDKVLSLKIYLSLFLSNLLLFLFTKKEKKKVIFSYQNKKDFSTLLENALNKSLKTIILIYGNSLFFYLISLIISRYLVLNTNSYILLNGLFDLMKGISSLALVRSNLKKALFTILFISFGGISIHMQVKSIITDTPIKYKNFLLGRIISTILAFIIFFLINTL